MRIKKEILLLSMVILFFGCSKVKHMFEGSPAYRAITEGDTTYFIDGLFGKGMMTYSHKLDKPGFFPIKENADAQYYKGIAAVNDFVISEDCFWIGSGFANGIYRVDKNTSVITTHLLKKNSGLYEDKIMGLNYIDGLLYIGYANYGIGVFNPITGEIKNYPYCYEDKKEKHINYVGINRIIKYKDVIIVGTMEIGALFFKDGVFYPIYDAWNNEWLAILNEERINPIAGTSAIYADNEYLIIALVAEANKDKKGPVYVYNNSEYFKINDINQFFAGEYGNAIQRILRVGSLFLMVYSEGIIIYDIKNKKVVRNIPSKEMKLIDYYIYNIDIDQDYVWVSTMVGVSRIEKEWFLQKYVYN